MNTVTEWSVNFDLAYNNVTSNQAPGLNEYEKSVFLTKAQTEILKNYLNPKGNRYLEGMDDSKKRQIDFSMLIRTAVLTTPVSDSSYVKVDPRSRVYTLPTGILVSMNESLIEKSRGTQAVLSTKTVVPLSYEEYMRLMQKPYKNPVKGQVWRLQNTNILSDSVNPTVELIGKINSSTDVEYIIRYIKVPRPIILSELPPELAIEGQTEPSTCELDPEIHDEILQRAVELAKVTWAGDLNTITTIGQRSE